jgi:hypothetical protein
MACLTKGKPADQKAEIEVREVLATAAEQARQEAIEHESQSEEHEEREE